MVVLRFDDSEILRDTFRFKNIACPIGSPKFYLIATCLAAVPVIVTYDKWYGQWFLFGALVSPVFEESVEGSQSVLERTG